MSILNKLTEGIVRRDLSKEGAALLSKWEKTGLLEGLNDERTKHGMASLLENQAKELLREASSMQTGDVEGFASVAFPIVRRVFGGLIANDLVSVQPMSLPSGLIFFLDFTYTNSRLDYASESSVYGGGVVGSQITGGISLSDNEAEQSFYALNNGYSSPTASLTITTTATISDGLVGGLSSGVAAGLEISKEVRWDADLALDDAVAFCDIDLTSTQMNVRDLVTITLFNASGDPLLNQVRRLTREISPKVYRVFVSLPKPALASDAVSQLQSATRVDFVIDDNFANVGAGSIGAVVGATEWGLEGEAGIPEIDIKVDSIAVTAKTKKLKAKWTPELAQDLNAYHNLDAEVELTSILSEHIALELDQEILEDLVKGATAGTLYWSRNPGEFVNRQTGVSITSTFGPPDFTGNVSEWYETLAETINDVSAQIHRKTLRGGANFIVCSPEVANLLEFTAGFRGAVTHDDDRGQVGAVKVGSLSKKFDVYVDPYFPRNVVLCGRKGSSFLESGYVYAPYVPLQMTPTIFGTEDFVPRKGVMTRYAKKMVRPDMYGLVIVTNLANQQTAPAGPQSKLGKY